MNVVQEDFCSACPGFPAYDSSDPEERPWHYCLCAQYLLEWLEVILPCIRDRQFALLHVKALHKKRAITSQQPWGDVGTYGGNDLWTQRTEIKAWKEACRVPQEGQYMITEPSQYLPAWSWSVAIFEHGWSGTVNWYQISGLDHMARIRNPKTGFVISWRHGLEFYPIIVIMSELTCITGLSLNSS